MEMPRILDQTKFSKKKFNFHTFHKQFGLIRILGPSKIIS